jgi:transposase InsO family protein
MVGALLRWGFGVSIVGDHGAGHGQRFCTHDCDPAKLFRRYYGPEFIAEAVRDWLTKVGVVTLYIEPGSPWENGYVESFNARFRDELLNGEIFYTLREAKVVIERWRREYNEVRPHSSLGYRAPAPLARELAGVGVESGRQEV